MTRPANVAVAVGVAWSWCCSRSLRPMRRRTTGSTRCCGRASPSSCSNGWSGCTTPFVAQRGLAYLFSAAGWSTCSPPRLFPLAIILGVQSGDRLAARCGLDAEGGSGDTGVAAAAPGAGGGIRVAAERAGDLPDGGVARLGGRCTMLERDVQPVAFGSVPAALWWAVITLTTVGYGDVVPVTAIGRLLAAFVMICGLGVFGLWTGILATGFAAETRRDNFLKTWESRSAKCRSSPTSAPPRSPTSPTCCAPWTCRRAP